MQYLSIPKLTSPSVFMDQIPIQPFVPSQKCRCHCGYSSSLYTPSWAMLLPRGSHPLTHSISHPDMLLLGLQHLIQALLHFSTELSSLLPEGFSEQVHLPFYVSLLSTKLPHTISHTSKCAYTKGYVFQNFTRLRQLFLACAVTIHPYLEVSLLLRILLTLLPG